MFFKWKRADGSDGELAVDATVTESHLSSATVTSHPVEKGAPLNNHVRMEPLRLSCECVVTNRPLSLPWTHNRDSKESTDSVDLKTEKRTLKQAARVVRFSDRMDRVGDVWAELEGLKLAAQLLTIETALRDYQNMAIVALSAPRSSEYGGKEAIRFTVDLQQIITVETQTVALPPATKKKKGHKPAKQADEKKSPKASMLHNLVQNLGLGVK